MSIYMFARRQVSEVTSNKMK